MQIDVMPVLIDQFRETFEGEINGMCWITDGPATSAVFGVIDAVPAQQAFAAPAAGTKSIAAHVEHLRFSLDLMIQRMKGENPKADWKSSFNVPPASEDAWTKLRSELRRAYDGVLSVLQQSRGTPVEKMPPLHVVGLAALIAHNAYHLGAIRQVAKVVMSAR